jgi:hypothetical protein
MKFYEWNVTELIAPGDKVLVGMTWRGEMRTEWCEVVSTDDELGIVRVTFPEYGVKSFSENDIIDWES